MAKSKNMLLALATSLLSIAITPQLHATESQNSSVPSTAKSNPTEEIFDACAHGNTERLRQWIEAGGDVNVSAGKGFTLMRIACLFGYTDIIEMLINANADIECCDENGKTLLIHCCSNMSGFVKLMIESDTSNTPYRKSGPNIESLKLLVKAGANVKVRGNDGDTPLHRACLDGFTDIVEVLIKAGADVNIIGRWETTSLHNACLRGHKEIVKILLSSDVSSSINAQNEFKETPLLVACHKGFIDIAEMLIKAGADVNITDNHIQTPLHVASMHGHTNIIKLLIAANANIHARDIKNLRPIDYFRMEDKEIREMLNALPSPKSYLGQTIKK